MCFTYEVLETFCNLPILAANPKNCLHRTPHFPMTSQRAHPTAPNPRHSMAQRRVRSKHHTCTTPQRRTCATPCCQVPRRSQYRARSARPPSALLQSCRKSGNKKVIEIATFLRLAIAADVQITDRAPKMKQNDRPVPHFHFTGDEKEPLIAKKLRRRQDFCFRKANYRNRSRFRNEPIAATRRTPMNDART